MKVTRKGNKRSSILATRSCIDDVPEYIKVRLSKYNCPQDEDLLFVTNYKENKDLVLLRDQLGHTSVEVTSIYTNINNEKKREAVYRLKRRQFE